MNDMKQVVFLRPNDVLFSYDLIAVDIYNQLRQHMSEEDREHFRILVESAFNNDMYLYSMKYAPNGDMYFISDIERSPVSIDDYDKLIISKKQSLITNDAWEWLYNSKYVDLMFRVNISFFNRAIADIEDGFNLFVLSFDDKYPESYYIGRYFKDKKKLEEKIIDIRKLGAWFKFLLDENENGVITTIWVSDSFADPYKIIEACVDVYGLDVAYTERIMIEANLVSLNEDNMRAAKEISEQDHIDGNVGVINPFKLGLLNSLYNNNQ